MPQGVSRSDCYPMRTVSLVYRPLGFDMEWRFTFHYTLLKTHLIEYPTATIQICDTNMILVIQLSAMKSESCRLNSARITRIDGTLLRLPSEIKGEPFAALIIYVTI